MRLAVLSFLRLALCALTICLSVAFTAQALELRLDTPQVDLKNDIALLEDPEGELGIEDISRPETAQRFVAWDGMRGQVNLGFTPSTWWFRVQLHRAPGAPGSWILEVPYAYNRFLDIYAPGQPPVLSGHARPLQSRPIFSRYVAMPVNVSEQTQTYFLRVQSNYALSLPLLLWQPFEYAKYTTAQTMLECLHYGGLLVLMLYSLFLFASLKDARMGWYALFALMTNLGTSTANGWGSMFFWPGWSDFDEVSSGLFYSLAIACFLVCVRQILGTKPVWPSMDAALRWVSLLYVTLSGLFVLAIGSPTWTSHVFQWLLALALFTIALVWLLVISRRIRSRPGAAYFALAWFCLTAGTLVGILRAFEWLPTNAWTSYAVQIGSGLEMLLLSFALSAMVRHEHRQIRAAQEQALVHLKAQEERLEATVLSRTQDLQAGLEREHHILTQYLRFAALISHEFRNGLNVISAQADNLRKALSDTGLVRRTEVITQVVHRLKSLTEKWLQGDRLLSLRTRAVVEPLDLRIWLENFLQKMDIRPDMHRVVVTLDPEVHTLDADAELLEIVLRNLLENACKYSPPGSMIEVRALRSQAMTGITVSDHGPGIAPDLQALIFEPYYRTDPESSISGLGLGLNFVRHIAELHGGKVTLDSTLGQGSTFGIWFPERDHEKN